MTDEGPIVIVGAGVAGGAAAAGLRQAGFDGEILVIGAEAQLPYYRPALSKEYLRGEKPLEFEPSAGLFRDGRAQLLSGDPVTSVRPRDRQLQLKSGREVTYRQLLLATGGRNRRLAIPGDALQKIHYLRGVDDADGIRSEAAAGAAAVIVGLGFIGCEVAASLRQRGVEVTALEPSAAPLGRLFGREVGDWLAQIHREEGVDVILEDTAVEFAGERTVSAVKTRAGREIPADFVVVGIGIEPEIGLLEGSGIAVSNGIVVDELCRTSVPGVFAAGDLANHPNPILGERLRVEHYYHAQWQGEAAALSIIGDGQPYARVPSFWSTQYGHFLEYRGHHNPGAAQVVRGSLAARNFLVFYVADGRVRGALSLGRSDELQTAERLIESGTVVRPEQLADEAKDLANLLDR